MKPRVPVVMAEGCPVQGRSLTPAAPDVVPPSGADRAATATAGFAVVLPAGRQVLQGHGEGRGGDRGQAAGVQVGHAGLFDERLGQRTGTGPLEV